MTWWVRKNGRVEGPFKEEDVQKRIRLNLLGSLDSVSSDGKRWKYLKDTELWRPIKVRTVEDDPPPLPPPLPASAVPPMAQGGHPAAPGMARVGHPAAPGMARVGHPAAPGMARVGHPAAPGMAQGQQPTPVPRKLRLRSDARFPGGTNKILIWCVAGIALGLVLVAVLTTVMVMTFSRRNGGSVKNSGAARAVDDFAAVKEKIALIECNKEGGRGTGFLLGMGGKTYLVSNEHVVRSGGAIQARLIDGTILQLGEFSVAGDGRDLARFEVQNCNIAPLNLRESIPDMNEQVTVYGNSLGSGVATETRGFVQGVGPTSIETNAEIVRGNSGSPLIDSRGEVVGVAALMRLTDSGKEDWGNTNTRYDGNVRRFAVRMNGTNWKTLQRADYEKQVRALEEFKTYWGYLVPFLLFDTRKVSEQDLVYNDLNSKEFRLPGTGFDAKLKAVAEAYERLGKAFKKWDEFCNGRESYVRRINEALRNAEITEESAKKLIGKYEENTREAYEKLKETLRKMILVRKEALKHAQTFLGGWSWDAPQVAHGYDDDSSGSVAEYLKYLRNAIDLMDQKMKDLDKGIKEIEHGDDE